MKCCSGAKKSSESRSQRTIPRRICVISSSPQKMCECSCVCFPAGENQVKIIFATVEHVLGATCSSTSTCLFMMNCLWHKFSLDCCRDLLPDNETGQGKTLDKTEDFNFWISILLWWYLYSCSLALCMTFQASPMRAY